MIKLLAMNYSPRPDNYTAVSHRRADGSARGRNTCFVNTSPNFGDCLLHLMKQMLATTGGKWMPSLSISEAALWGKTSTPASSRAGWGPCMQPHEHIPAQDSFCCVPWTPQAHHPWLRGARFSQSNLYGPHLYYKYKLSTSQSVSTMRAGYRMTREAPGSFLHLCRISSHRAWAVGPQGLFYL